MPSRETGMDLSRDEIKALCNIELAINNLRRAVDWLAFAVCAEGLGIIMAIVLHK